jgi:Gram-negative bacterial TonB protein C-terminal
VERIELKIPLDIDRKYMKIKMKKIILCLAILLLGFGSQAQKIDTIFVSTNDTLVNINGRIVQLMKAEKLPSFSGGTKAFSKFLETEIDLYAARQTQTAILSFIVEPDGSLTEIIVLNKSDLESDVIKNALQIFKHSPKWLPAEHKGQKVRFFATQQIEYNRDN